MRPARRVAELGSLGVIAERSYSLMAKKNKRGVIRPSPRQSQKAAQRPQRKGILRYVGGLLSPSGLFWTSVSLVITILGAYFLFRTQISIEPDVSLDPSNPNATLFKITNQGVLPIYELTTDISDISARDANGYTVMSGISMSGWGPPVFKLATAESTTVTLPTYISPLGPQRAALNIRYKDCDVTVFCTYKDLLGFDHHKLMRFQCILGTDGLARWYHKESTK